MESFKRSGTRANFEFIPRRLYGLRSLLNNFSLPDLARRGSLSDPVQISLGERGNRGQAYPIHFINTPPDSLIRVLQKLEERGGRSGGGLYRMIDIELFPFDRMANVWREGYLVRL